MRPSRSTPHAPSFKNEKHRKQWLSSIGEVFKAFGPKRVDAITSADILAALNCAAEQPERVEHYQRILAVPFKRTRSRPVEYLDFAEIQAVLAAIDRSSTDGRRDYALLASMFNTGARVQEIVALRVADLRLESPPHLRLFGKGRKERICPLWSQTADLLRALLAERGHPRADQPLFVNHRAGPLTRFGVRYILAKYCTQSAEVTPTLATKRSHQDEATFWREFDQARPRILGALLDAVSCGIRRVPDVHLERKPRMADFAVWGVAVEPACQWPAGTFFRAR